VENDRPVKMVSGFGLESSGSGHGPEAGACEHCNESFSSVKCEKYLYNITDCQLLKTESTA
jgi:hypothetical protein